MRAIDAFYCCQQNEAAAAEERLWRVAVVQHHMRYVA